MAKLPSDEVFVATLLATKKFYGAFPIKFIKVTSSLVTSPRNRNCGGRCGEVCWGVGGGVGGGAGKCAGLWGEVRKDVWEWRRVGECMG